MKLLIAYDGSEFANAAIVDLRRAGLPEKAEVVVLSVAELFPELPSLCYSCAAAEGREYGHGAASGALGGYELSKAKAFAAQAVERLQADFPGWWISAETWIDSAAAAIVRKAHAWKPDLVVIGSHGQSGLTNFDLGSVSQHVLHYAGCSVRISRHRLHSQERPIRLLVGVDGSAESKLAVRRVASRNWAAGAEVRVVAALDPESPSGSTAQAELSKAVDEAVRELSKTSLRVTGGLLFGNPGEMLLSEAEKCGADCVFVGSKRRNESEYMIHDSVAAAVASRAQCSVELVRPSPQ